MNNSTFNYLETKKTPQGSAVITDGKNLHIVFCNFSFSKKEEVIKLVIIIQSDIEHGLLYNITTETYFESDNTVFTDELISVMDKYIQKSYSDHYDILIENFKPFGLSGFDFKESVNYSSYLYSLSKALDKAKKDFN